MKSSGWLCASLWHLSRGSLSFLAVLPGQSMKSRKLLVQGGSDMGHLATAVVQSCLTRINDMGGPADPAESTGQVLLLTFTEATIMVNHWQCKHSSRDAQKSCSWTRAIIKRINFKSLPKHLWWSDHKAQSKCWWKIRSRWSQQHFYR